MVISFDSLSSSIIIRPFICPFNQLIHSGYCIIVCHKSSLLLPFHLPFHLPLRSSYFPTFSHISENTAAAVIRLLLIRPVVGRIPVLSLLEFHMVLGHTHILQFGYSQSARNGLRFSEYPKTAKTLHFNLKIHSTERFLIYFI